MTGCDGLPGLNWRRFFSRAVIQKSVTIRHPSLNLDFCAEVVKLRDAVEARTVTGDNGALVRVDRELMGLHRAACLACPDSLVTLEGQVLPGGDFDAGAAYDPAAAKAEAERSYEAGEVTLEIFNNLIRYADRAQRNHSESTFEQRRAA